MIVGGTFRVIGQDFDHATVGDPAVPALPHHALEFRLERRKAGDPGLHFMQVGTGDPIGLITLPIRIVAEVKQSADRA